MGKAARLSNGDAEQTLYSRVTPSALEKIGGSPAGRTVVASYVANIWLQGSYVELGVGPGPAHYDERHSNCNGKQAGFLAMCSAKLAIRRSRRSAARSRARS